MLVSRVQQSPPRASLDLPRNARLNLSRSRMLSPPSIFGLVAFSHSTWQWPPFAEAAPFQKNDLLILSIFLTAHFFKANTVTFFEREVFSVGETVTTQPLRGNSTCWIQLTSVEDWQVQCQVETIWQYSVFLSNFRILT